jgi:hypothetical protein
MALSIRPGIENVIEGQVNVNRIKKFMTLSYSRIRELEPFCQHKKLTKRISS